LTQAIDKIDYQGTGTAGVFQLGARRREGVNDLERAANVLQGIVGNRLKYRSTH